MVEITDKNEIKTQIRKKWVQRNVTQGAEGSKEKRQSTGDNRGQRASGTAPPEALQYDSPTYIYLQRRREK